jgi:hypothetical protein
MTRGRTSRVLSTADRRRLRQFQEEHSHRLGVSVGGPQLKSAMEAPFSWETLQRALRGLAISADYHQFIVAFLDRHVPEPRAPLDYKQRASGETEEENGAAITHRGSR